MHSESQPSKNLKGTWNQALLSLLIPILVVLGVRWAVVEPFVIPSGSMIPNLLIYDHILVKKFAYGLRVPFANSWLVEWSKPQRGDIIVFKYPENPEVYYVKTLMGLPGDELKITQGRVVLNGEALPLIETQGAEKGFEYFREKIGSIEHTVRFLTAPEGETQTIHVGENEFFFMGDNRDQSSDSRAWGTVPKKYLVGKAWVIWLSCENTLPTMNFVCDPSQIRWSRLLQKL